MSWLKIETTTPAKPEIAQIARLCSCSKAEAFLAFFRFLVWADAMTSDGFIEFITADDCDEHSALKGFGKAMAAAKWLTFDDHGATLTNFDRHNGESAKRRAEKSERQRRWRQRNVDASMSTHVDAPTSTPASTREEKRR